MGAKIRQIYQRSSIQRKTRVNGGKNEFKRLQNILGKIWTSHLVNPSVSKRTHSLENHERDKKKVLSDSYNDQ